MTDGKLDEKKIKQTVSTARMLDNVININYYSVDTLQKLKHEAQTNWAWFDGISGCPIPQNIPYCSDEAVEFADRSMEMISYNAILASTELAKERGAYESFEWLIVESRCTPERLIRYSRKTQRKRISTS